MNTTTEDMRIIARNIICINPQNPRADQGDLSELAASIKALVKACGMDWDELEQVAEAEAVQE